MLGSATGKAGRRGTAAAAAAASAKSRPLTSNVHSAPLPCQRHLFAVPSDEAEVCYLNAAYMSPSLATTELAWATGATRKSSPWEITKADFYDGPERLRAATASLIGAASPDCVALVPSSSCQDLDNLPGRPNWDDLHPCRLCHFPSSTFFCFWGCAPSL